MVYAGLLRTGWPVTSVNFTFMLYYVIIYCYSLLFCLSTDVDNSIKLEAIHYVISVTFLFLFLAVFKLQEHLLEEFIRVLDEGRYQYGDTIDPETQLELEQIHSSTLNRKNLFANFITAFYSIFGYGTILLFPLISGKYSMPEPDDYYLRRAPMAKYNVYYSKSGFGWYFSAFLDLLMISEIVFIICAIDVPFVCFSEEIIKELKIVSATLRNIYRRARYVYKRRYKQYAVTYESAEFRSCLVECMQESLKHHIAATKCSQVFDKAYGMPVMFFFLSGPIYICPSGVVLLMKSASIASKIEAVIHIAIGLQHNFIFAYYGESMSQMSSRIRNDAFYMGWEDASPPLKPYLSMMQGYIQTKPMKITALGIIDYNFETYKDIVRSAYTYLNILWRVMK